MIGKDAVILQKTALYMIGVPAVPALVRVLGDVEANADSRYNALAAFRLIYQSNIEGAIRVLHRRT